MSKHFLRSFSVKKSNWSRLFSLSLWFFLSLAAFAIPSFFPDGYQEQYLEYRHSPPSLTFWLGTDHLGRNLFLRCCFALRTSLTLSLLSTLGNLCMGVLAALLMVLYKGRWLESFFLSISYLFYTIPSLLLSLFLVTLLSSGRLALICTFLLSRWVQIAFLIRGELLKLFQRDFFRLSQSMGASPYHLLFHHCLAHLAESIELSLLVNIRSFIFLETTLSYLGIGITPPLPSLGALIRVGEPYRKIYPWLFYAPSLFTCLLIVSLYVSRKKISKGIEKKISI